MKKGPRGIPDISRKPNQVLNKGVRPETESGQPKPQTPIVKPTATTKKGGRRGG